MATPVLPLVALGWLGSPELLLCVRDARQTLLGVGVT